MKQATPLTSRTRIAAAFSQLTATLRKGAKPEYGGYWSKSGRFWYFVGEGNRRMRGVYFHAEDSYATTVALNIERARPTRAFGGLFVNLAGHGSCVVHSGRLWCGKRKFMAWYRQQHGDGSLVSVAWPNRRGTTSYVLLGGIASPDLERGVADYVDAVHKFRLKYGPSLPKPELRRVPTQLVPRSVARSVTSVTHKSKVQVRHDHKVVLHALARALSESGHGRKFWYDRERDLFIGTSKGPANILFEIKTEDNTTSIYTGIGQLMYHGVRDKLIPRRVLVWPALPDKGTLALLRRLGIRVLSYCWSERKPRFSPLQLEKALE